MRTQILGLGALLLALQACSDDPAANDGKPTIDGSAAASLDCASLIPAAAIDALGWPAVEPEEHAGRCLVRSARGEVTVGTRAVPASADERADAVQAELETQCERLRADGRQFVGEPEWLAEGHQGCLTQVDPRTGTGVAELVFLNDIDEVVQVRIASSRRLDEDRVTDALEQIASASAGLGQP
ncbi:hypothetical protein HNR19_003233 [Nocardioides thalensis]|uniref:DUF3558 domain-containing protein n=1 Tax=Nocardioides thalensis TaxID=1914755 RepID=A0A853C481_9ACTN|nr:hypothetical protein [Nocardioides thalensis]NYJ02535.1 hypothetical protein [Nocardioides thalensis]